MCYPRIIWVIRHCEREDNVNRQWKNLPGMEVFVSDNSPLSERGRVQAKELGRRFRSEGIAQVFASPFDRTIETAHTIVEMNENENLTVKPEPGLCEALYLCAKPHPSFWDANELKKKFPKVDEEYDPVFSKYTLPRESVGDEACVPRLKKTIERIIQRYAGPIMLVGHGASIGAIHQVLTNDFKYVGQATVSKFVQSGNGIEEIKILVELPELTLCVMAYVGVLQLHEASLGPSQSASLMSVLLETSLGDVVIDLFYKERPNCSLNFLKLCKMKYYNLCQFHYIEKDYVAQTGDPTGTGRGGESVFGMMYGEQARYFEKEVVPKLRHNRRGLVSFVDGGNGMLGSQFFITLSNDGIDYLDEKHTIFGQVTEGDETLDALNSQVCDDKHSPFRDIRINHTTVIHDPFDDAKVLSYPRRSPSPTMEQLLVVNKIALDENEEEDDGKTAAEIEEEMREKEAKAQAQILEMVGDLRHADEKPMDNVLFVCKLNEVTTDEDLEIIFSRFGKIKCCEVIKDRRTQKSLQYAFIEFETNEACEQAFFKMDNVLIDDRRIHVDFSQSVAKNYKWEKGGVKKDGGRYGRSDGRPRREERKKSRSPRRRDRSREKRDEKRKRSRSRDHGRKDEKRRRERERSRDRSRR